MPQPDIFQQIRSQFERNPTPSFKRHPKVLVRDDTYFITDLPEKWRVDYERRNKHRHTGFFAHNHVPYKSFGNLRHTDVYELIGDHLEVTVTKHKAYQLTHFIQGHDLDEIGDTHNHQQTMVRDSSQKKSLPYSRDAGLSTIWLSLVANDRSMREMNAESSFRDTIEREEQRISFLNEVRAPKIIQNEIGEHNHLHNPSIYLSPMVHTASSKHSLTLTDFFHTSNKVTNPGGGDSVETQSQPKPQKSVGPNLYVALAAAQFKLHHTGHIMKDQEYKNQQSAVRKQMKRQCLAKLKAVHAILCCLHNIKLRDLRSREPLPPTTIKAISQKPLHSLKDHFHHHHDTHHHHHLHHFHHHHDTHHHHHLLTHTPGHRFTAHTPTPHHTGGVAHDISGNHVHNQWDKHHHSHMHGNFKHGSTHHGRGGHTVPRHVRIHAVPHLETWEDLLALDEEGRGTTQVGRVTSSRLHSSTNIHPHHGIHQKAHRSLPPWQKQVVYVDAKDGDMRKDPERQIHDCIGAFQYTKNEMAQEVRETLSERKQHLQKHLVTKLQELTLGVNVEESLDYMRERAYQISREERAEEDNKPAWYSHLEKESISVFESAGGEVRAALEKLKQFLCVDNDAIPHVVEKLCLLVMSLPANQLCLLPVINAVQFVLEYVLKVPVKLCSQWLALRRLPSVTTELMGPTFIFGTPV